MAVDTTKRNIAIVNAREIDDTCDLLKTLLDEATAKELLDAWKTNHEHRADSFNLSGIEVFGKLKNDEFRKYIHAKQSSTQAKSRPVAEILTGIHVNKSWGGEDFKLLATSTVEQYVESFRSSTAVDLALKGWIVLVNSEPITPENIAIFKAGKGALEQLSSESASSNILATSALRQVRSQVTQAAAEQ